MSSFRKKMEVVPSGVAVSHPFESVFDTRSRVFVLGSFPSEAAFSFPAIGKI